MTETQRQTRTPEDKTERDRDRPRKKKPKDCATLEWHAEETHDERQNGEKEGNE